MLKLVANPGAVLKIAIAHVVIPGGEAPVHVSCSTWYLAGDQACPNRNHFALGQPCLTVLAATSKQQQADWGRLSEELQKQTLALHESSQKKFQLEDELQRHSWARLGIGVQVDPSWRQMGESGQY